MKNTQSTKTRAQRSDCRFFRSLAHALRTKHRGAISAIARSMGVPGFYISSYLHNGRIPRKRRDDFVRAFEEIVGDKILLQKLKLRMVEIERREQPAIEPEEPKHIDSGNGCAECDDGLREKDLHEKLMHIKMTAQKLLKVIEDVERMLK